MWKRLNNMLKMQGRSCAKPNETLALGPQKFWKKLYRKKLLKFFFRPLNLPNFFFSWNILKTAYSPLNLMAGPVNMHIYLNGFIKTHTPTSPGTDPDIREI